MGLLHEKLGWRWSLILISMVMLLKYVWVLIRKMIFNITMIVHVSLVIIMGKHLLSGVHLHYYLKLI